MGNGKILNVVDKKHKGFALNNPTTNATAF
jgi:hypothetical protein